MNELQNQACMYDFSILAFERLNIQKPTAKQNDERFWVRLLLLYLSHCVNVCCDIIQNGVCVCARLAYPLNVFSSSLRFTAISFNACVFIPFLLNQTPRVSGMHVEYHKTKQQ